MFRQCKKIDQIFFTPKFLNFFQQFYLHQKFYFFTPIIPFLHQILKFRKRFFGKKWRKKAKNWCKTKSCRKVDPILSRLGIGQDEPYSGKTSF